MARTLTHTHTAHYKQPRRHHHNHQLQSRATSSELVGGCGGGDTSACTIIIMRAYKYAHAQYWQNAFAASSDARVCANAIYAAHGRERPRVALQKLLRLPNVACTGARKRTKLAHAPAMRSCARTRHLHIYNISHIHSPNHNRESCVIVLFSILLRTAPPHTHTTAPTAHSSTATHINRHRGAHEHRATDRM